MANETIQVFEWKIENFSCWCEAVHGKCIESPPFFFTHFKKAELYPRGVSGQDSHLVVQICDIESDFTGDLSFIGSDGSPIRTQQVKRTKKDEEVLGVSLGPILEEVVVRKADHKDEVTLRFCIPSADSYEQQMRTTIDVLKISLKIDPILIKIVKLEEAYIFFFIPYTSKKNANGMYLKIACQSDKIQLIMEPPVKNINAVFIESCTILSRDKALVKYEENKHVCINGEEWTFSDSLKIKELQESGTTILLRFKIINGLVNQSYNHLNYYTKETSIVPYDTPIGFSDLKSSKSPASSNQSEDSITVLTKELMCLYQDQDFSDFQLKCGDVTFQVHRAILSARSPVFKTMLSTDMKEATSGCMDIEDLDVPTLSHFLTYLYTGAVEELQCCRALKLYYAADKYQVPSLRKECADFLCNNISIENVCDILILGDKHKDDDVIAVSHNFVLNNFNELLGSKVWDNFKESEPMLALNTLTYFGKKNYLLKAHMP